MEVWHFVGDKLRDGRVVPADGVLLEHKGPVVPCKNGLHGSARIVDGLKFAPGNTICRCWLNGDLKSHGYPIDKWAGRRRTILWRIDGTDVLRRFAREQALSVVHLWDAPDIVRKYLETGDEVLRGVAWEAARAATRAAARAAAEAAARAAAGVASWDVAWDAAGAVAWDATRAATRAAARDAAGAAARAVAWDAARDAAEDAAGAAAWDAANTRLTKMVLAEHEKENKT